MELLQIIIQRGIFNKSPPLLFYLIHDNTKKQPSVIEFEYAKECEEVIVKWGDYGKRIKDIRAVIAKFPLNDLVENKNYDISSCPYGFEE